MGICIYLRRHHADFTTFHTEDFTKVVPIKVHLVSNTFMYIFIGFVSDGFYLMVESLYFYRIHSKC